MAKTERWLNVKGSMILICAFACLLYLVAILVPIIAEQISIVSGVVVVVTMGIAVGLVIFGIAKGTVLVETPDNTQDNASEPT